MKFRLLSLFLALVLIVGLIGVPALAAEDEDLLYGHVPGHQEPDDDIVIDEDTTENQLRTTHNGVEMIKELEGFIGTAYMDVSQYSIGYGCSTEYAKKYGFSTTSITREEADQLIVYVIAEMEEKLDTFLDTYSISLSDTQYDALISFTFNVGSSWMTSTSRLAQLLISGSYSENELASAMGVWCHVGTVVNDILVVRRIQEIKLFLYGAYTLDATDKKISYLEYDGNGGSVDVDIAFYVDGSTYSPLFSASHETEDFTGWFTTDGTQVTENTVVVDDLKVYARWGENGEIPSEDENEGDDPTALEPQHPVDLSTVFTDVSTEDWFYSYVYDLYVDGVVDGYSNHTFRPAKNVSTGEALKMILLAAGYAEPEQVASHWARGYLNLALDQGILDRGDITDLDVNMSRQLMAKVVVNALGLTPQSETSPFTDTDDWYVHALYDSGITDGYTDRTFRPDRALSRAELSAIVWRILNR